jgi:hypothetical protein
MSSAEHAESARPRIKASVVLTDGLYAGVIGGLLVALWFLILDTLAGHPFNTPSMLGTWVIRGPQAIAEGAVDPAMVAAYTAIHMVAFAAVGTLASYFFALFDRHPAAGIGLAFLFVFFEVGFFVFSAATGGDLLGRLGPVAVGVGNLLAAIGMGIYLWIRHPHIKESLVHIWDE